MLVTDNVIDDRARLPRSNLFHITLVLMAHGKSSHKDNKIKERHCKGNSLEKNIDKLHMHADKAFEHKNRALEVVLNKNVRHGVQKHFL